MARIASTVSRPCSRGRIEAELRRRARRGSRAGIRSQMPIVRSPCTLLCPRTGQAPAPGLADVAAQQQEIHDLAGSLATRVLVLGEAHRPAGDDPLGSAQTSAAASICSPRRGRWRRASVVPAMRVGRAPAKSSKPAGVLVDEVAGRAPHPAAASSAPAGAVHEPGSSAEVAADPDLQEQVGDPVAATDDPAWLLRILEPQQAGLRQRIDGDDRRAARLASSRAESMRGWLVPGFCPTMKIRSAYVEVLAGVTVPLPMPIVSVSAMPLDSWHMFEQSGRLLVPKRPDEELVEEGGLVAGAAGGVEDRLVGRGQRVQLARRSARRRRPS